MPSATWPYEELVREDVGWGWVGVVVSHSQPFTSFSLGWDTDKAFCSECTHSNLGLFIVTCAVESLVVM